MRDLTDIDTIREILGRNGFRFSKALGQNFLAASWVPEKTAEAAELDENAGVLEIGPGIGCLTVELSKRAGRVLAVELDEKLQPVLAETLSGCENTEVLFGDILKKDVGELVGENFAGMRPVVCANLPYNVTSPVLSRLLSAECFDSITVMVQRELALRICAEAGSQDYSAFSVFCRWYAEPEMLFDVGPECFIPRPKVTSSVIRLNVRREKPAHVDDEALFLRVVRAAFGQRRKTLANALSAGLGAPKQDMLSAIAKCGFCPDIRGETLDINEFAQISDAVEAVLAR